MEKEHTYRIAILEESPIDYQLLERNLRDEEDINIVYSEIDAVAFIDHMMEHIDEIDVALIDIMLKQDIDGLDVIRQLKTFIQTEGIENHAPKFIVFTKYDDLANFVKSIEAGAAGFLRKEPPLRIDPITKKRTHDGAFIVDYGLAIRAVAGGQTCFDQELIHELIKDYRKYVSLSQDISARQKFTRKQIEIMSLRIEHSDFTNGEIAVALALKEQTIRGHMVNIHSKIGVNNYSDAIETWKRLDLPIIPLRPDITKRANDILKRRNSGV